MTRSDEELDALAGHLHARRSHILQGWQDSVAHDPQLTAAATVSHAQFTDHIPQVLDAYERRLRAREPDERRLARIAQRENAAEHGLLRWQQGYAQRETMREWGHLHLCLLRELERYESEHPGLDDAVMPTARATLVRLCAEGVCESAARYLRLQQAEAAGRVKELEQALQELTSMEQQRVQMWREAAHDLRGTVGVISNASAIIASNAVQDGVRAQFSDVLGRSVAALRELLNDLIDLGRLQAGQEQRRIVSFDAASLLRDFGDSMRALAGERNLFLKCQGPGCLQVEGDPIKVRRIVQNLVLNALKATQSGGVQITWQERTLPGARQWAVCVQDTGPGFDVAHAAPVERLLKQATVESHDVGMRASLAGDETAIGDPAPMLASESGPSPPSPPHGEGIGLYIVKRLCELLDATIELETAKGTGTTFRVIFPRDYRGVVVG